MLICPKCKEKLKLIDRTYKCINNHCFDISKEGYVNLLLNKSDSGDNKEMVDARLAFLNKGYYNFLIDKVMSYIDKNNIILDCGCGEGYYTNYIKKSLGCVIFGTDISKSAIQKAAKRNVGKDINYFVSSIFDIPIAEDCVDVILNICAPHFEKEFKRILKEGGKILKVIPAKNHLIELKEFLYSEVYLNDDSVDMSSFKLKDNIKVESKHAINNEDIRNLFIMTPYYYKTKKQDIERLFKLEKLDITFSFNIHIYEV